MKLSEKNMEDQIWEDPSKFIGENNLVKIERQIILDGYRADLLFEDSNGSYLLLEIQKGGLDRTHIWKILDYGFRLKKINGHKPIRLMVIANNIRKRQIETLNHLRVEYKQVHESQFNDETLNKSSPLLIDNSVTITEKEFEDSVFDRGIDGRHFGFSGKRAIAASLYARNEGASQEEVNNFMRELTSQTGFYNMLDKANAWGHEVAVWQDPTRGKVFKLIYNPNHTARTKGRPPEGWEKLNECAVPSGKSVGSYIRTTK